MLIIGLTGGIGSGKSTVADLFSNYDIPIIDADVISREITQPGSETLTKIVSYFGQDILLPTGLLNRSLLRAIIFQKPEARVFLEDLLHPLILENIFKQIDFYKQANKLYIIIVIPLLIETKTYTFLDRILVVDCDESLQIERIQTRDKISLEIIKNIMDTQASREQRLAIADDIIYNYSDYNNLAAQVAKLHAQYSNLAKN